jgi:hypothetical protein
MEYEYTPSLSISVRHFSPTDSPTRGAPKVSKDACVHQMFTGASIQHLTHRRYEHPYLARP